ncbi:GNAT family N-acetyltransferase [Alterisphingorhabdus coralli]|uniref:GNAT family N-acetyltransferase n=1 Tax=Alterisphingorhabdus coralli TaxID=3071408 RepID=A0AA97FAX9_9SPHN|nr:GNAT family N-acetyltransferase [Parasphingorhabdus sp. SCSIO 66989]WOE76272.1 GNAT family N-acetyltransferase [Parasphingorhabdus sp. SCSIO 66989]
MRQIREDDVTSPAVTELLELHLAEMEGFSPPNSVHALNAAALKVPGITVYAAWDNGGLSGVGALRQVDDKHGEIKSMRTHPDYLRRGVAADILEHIIGIARERGYMELSLETGSGAVFEPALALYRKRGFENGPVFGDYAQTDFNQFLHLML